MVNESTDNKSESDFIGKRRDENQVVSNLADQGKLIGKNSDTKSGLAFLLTRPLSRRMARLVAKEAGIITEDETNEASDHFPDVFNGQN